MTNTKFKKFNIETYKPGKSNGGVYKKAIKLSANESALGVSPKARKVISNKNVYFFRYPDGKAKKLREQISKKFKCDKEKIICGAGSDEIIQLLCQLFLGPRDEVIVPQYSFLIYRIYSKIAGAKVIFSKEKNFKVSIFEILKKFELLELRKKLRKNILLVLDDAYFEYMRDPKYVSALDLFKKKQNVFILRTFSKIYGLASLRVGWGYGAKKIINELNKIKPPFNVNEIAQLAAIESLKDLKFISKSIKHNFIYATKLKKFLERFNISSNKVSANFLLLNFTNCEFTAKNFYRKLEAKGILLRSAEDGYKIKNMLRLTIGSRTDTLKFMKVVKDIFKK